MADIFAIADKAAAEFVEQPIIETYTLVLGSKSSGKSTLVSSFLHPSAEDAPKPTIGLDYDFGRRSGASKDVAHVWELGGGSTVYQELLSIVFTPARLPNNVLVYVIDLSCPYAALEHMVTWLGYVRGKVAEVMEKLSKSAGKSAAGTTFTAPDVLTRMSSSRVKLGWAQRTGVAVLMPPSAGGGAEVPITLLGPTESAFIHANLPDHPDSSVISQSILPFPCIFVANKYDAIREEDAMKKQAILNACRYIAHCHGAHFVCTSMRDRQSIAAFKSLLAHCAFGSEYKRVPVTDIQKPMYIPAGSDALEAIGTPMVVSGIAPATKGDVESGPFEARFSKYLLPVKHFFPPDLSAPLDEKIDASAIPPAPSAVVPGSVVEFNDVASKHAEPVIDMLRAQAVEETAKYVREQERKLRMEAKGEKA